MPYIEGENRNQLTLFPESINDYITEDNVVRVIDVYVDQIDVVAYKFTFAHCPNIGRPPYSPQVMLKLYIYGYLNRIRSSRRLEHEAKRNVELMWLLGKLAPDFKTIADFRKNNKKSLVKIFKDFTRLCRDWDLFGKELVAVDGSKFKASNSKKNNYSKKKLQRHLKYIDEKIKGYLKELEENDIAEQDEWKPSTKEIKEKIEKLKERKEKYEGFEKELEESGENEISTTDPDARLMSNNNNNVDVSYNVQTAVDSKHKLIVAFKVTMQPNDFGQLSPMALTVKDFFGVNLLDILGDKGYYKTECLIECLENGIMPYVSKQVYANRTGDKEFYPDKFNYDKEKDVYICPEGKELIKATVRKKQKDGIIGYNYRNYQACQGCCVKDRCTTNKKGRSIFRHINQDRLEQVDLKNEENMAKYKQRKMIAEHPFGTIKQSWDAGYFLTRGVPSVSAETALSYLAYNLKRVINIMGVEEMVKRLKERGNPVLV